jgi:hypothetical protein
MANAIYSHFLRLQAPASRSVTVAGSQVKGCPFLLFLKLMQRAKEIHHRQSRSDRLFSSRESSVLLS